MDIRSKQQLILIVVTSAVAVFCTRVAAANPRTLPFTYPWESLGEGQVEVEQYVDIVPLRIVEDPSAPASAQVVEPRYELQTEFEYGITDRLELGLYLVMKNEPESGGSGAPLVFDGVKQRLRYRIGREGQLPVETSLYLELAELRDEIEVEEKVNLQKRWGNLKVLANLGVEQAIERGGEAELKLRPTAGITYQFTPHLVSGVEYWMVAKLPLGQEEEEEENEDPISEFNHAPHHFVGPTVALVWDKIWWSFAGYARVDGFSRAMRPGEKYGHIWIRSIVGLPF